MFALGAAEAPPGDWQRHLATYADSAESEVRWSSAASGATRSHRKVNRKSAIESRSRISASRKRFGQQLVKANIEPSCTVCCYVTRFERDLDCINSRRSKQRAMGLKLTAKPGGAMFTLVEQRESAVIGESALRKRTLLRGA